MKQTGVVACVLAPHPPLLIPEIGKGDLAAVKATALAMEELACRVKQSRPDVVIVISPHAPLFEDVIAILTDDPLSGDFSTFGVSRAAYSFRNDPELIDAIMDQSARAGIMTYRFDSRSRRRYGRAQGLDHGVLVPMHFIGKETGPEVPLVAMGTALLTRNELYDFGKVIDKAAGELKRRAVLVASGDLSHRLIPQAPAGYDVKGREFDETLICLLRDMDVEGILSLDDSLLERAGECGYRPLVTALGALDGDDPKSEVLSYEGPFGVGYGCVIVGPDVDSTEGCYSASCDSASHGSTSCDSKSCDSTACDSPSCDSTAYDSSPCSSRESFPVRLARAAVESYVKYREIIEPPDDIGEESRRQAGVFCTLRIEGQLRGCIGTIEPTTGSIPEEIIRNAIAAATEDPRFLPVRKNELSSISYSVDVLMPSQRVHSIDELDPKVYGVIVRKGRKRGLLLPDIEGVDTPHEQVAIAKRKAGIGQDEEVELRRFEVKRYT